MCALSGEALLTELTFQGAWDWNGSSSILSPMLTVNLRAAKLLQVLWPSPGVSGDSEGISFWSKPNCKVQMLRDRLICARRSEIS